MLGKSHLCVPHDYVTDDEYAFPLGRRVNCIRTSGAYLNGHPDRIAWVQSMGWVDSVPDAMWEDLKGHLTRYYARKGNLRVPRAYVTDDAYRGMRVNAMRSSGAYLDGHPDRIAWVQSMGWVDSEWDAMWEDVKGHLTRYYAREGHLRVPGYM